jgi:hypothetical protein
MNEGQYTSVYRNENGITIVVVLERQETERRQR